jgi:hypothetical protein
MRYDDRITSVELNDTNELLALLNESDVQDAQDAQADQSRESYQCDSEYDDQEWLDKGNW